MAINQGLGTIWNLPNFAGELFTADMEQSPLLSMIGGLTGGMRTDNFEFPTALLYDYPAPDQPEISEKASAGALVTTSIPREQEYNTVQIHREAVELTYWKMSNSGRMSGLNTAGQNPSPNDDLAWQITRKLIKIARDVEYSFISGVYQKATSEATAGKTRGMIELTKSTGGTHIDANGAALDKAMLKALYKEMADSGAYFDNMVMFVPSGLKQAVSEIYNNQFGFNLPSTRNVGGVNITTIETDFFNMGVVWSRFMKEDELLITDVAHLAPVFLEVPGKGVLFVEDKEAEGASEKRMLYGQIGLAHGPAFLHGSITNLGE